MRVGVERNHRYQKLVLELLRLLGERDSDVFRSLDLSDLPDNDITGRLRRILDDAVAEGVVLYSSSRRWHADPSAPVSVDVVLRQTYSILNTRIATRLAHAESLRNNHYGTRCQEFGLELPSSVEAFTKLRGRVLELINERDADRLYLADAIELMKAHGLIIENVEGGRYALSPAGERQLSATVWDRIRSALHVGRAERSKLLSSSYSR